MKLEKFAMTALVEKLAALGGDGPFKSREWKIRSRLNWHTKARSAVRHILAGARKVSLEEAQQIEAAHMKYCAEKVEANRDENRKLLDALARSLAAMEASDPDYFSEQVEAVREILFRRGNANAENGGEAS